jgi:hypothetical protein
VCGEDINTKLAADRKPSSQYVDINFSVRVAIKLTM